MALHVQPVRVAHARVGYRRHCLLSTIFDSNALVPYAPQIGAVILTWTVGSFLDIVAVARQHVRASTLFIIGSQGSKTVVFLVAALTAGSVGALINSAIVQGVRSSGGGHLAPGRRTQHVFGSAEPRVDRVSVITGLRIAAKERVPSTAFQRDEVTRNLHGCNSNEPDAA